MLLRSSNAQNSYLELSHSSLAGKRKLTNLSLTCQIMGFLNAFRYFSIFATCSLQSLFFMRLSQLVHLTFKYTVPIWKLRQSCPASSTYSLLSFRYLMYFWFFSFAILFILLIWLISIVFLFFIYFIFIADSRLNPWKTTASACLFRQCTKYIYLVDRSHHKLTEYCSLNLSRIACVTFLMSSSARRRAAMAVIVPLVWMRTWILDSEGWGTEYPQNSISQLQVIKQSFSYFRKIKCLRRFPIVWSSCQIQKVIEYSESTDNCKIIKVKYQFYGGGGSGNRIVGQNYPIWINRRILRTLWIHKIKKFKKVLLERIELSASAYLNTFMLYV